MNKPFFIWYNKVLKKIYPEEVVCLITVKNYTKIFVAIDRYYMVRSTLANALKKLPPELFVRINRSIVISINHIDCIQKDHLLIGETPLPIDKRHYKALLEKLTIIE